MNQARIAITLRPVHHKRRRIVYPAVNMGHPDAMLFEHLHHQHLVLEAVELGAGAIALEEQRTLDAVLAVLNPPDGTPAHQPLNAGNLAPHMLFHPVADVGHLALFGDFHVFNG